MTSLNELELSILDLFAKSNWNEFNRTWHNSKYIAAKLNVDESKVIYRLRKLRKLKLMRSVTVGRLLFWSNENGVNPGNYLDIKRILLQNKNRTVSQVTFTQTKVGHWVARRVSDNVLVGEVLQIDPHNWPGPKEKDRYEVRYYTKADGSRKYGAHVYRVYATWKQICERFQGR